MFPRSSDRYATSFEGLIWFHSDSAYIFNSVPYDIFFILFVGVDEFHLWHFNITDVLFNVGIKSLMQFSFLTPTRRHCDIHTRDTTNDDTQSKKFNRRVWSQSTSIYTGFVICHTKWINIYVLLCLTLNYIKHNKNTCLFM